MQHSSEQPNWDLEALLREESWIRRIARDLVHDSARVDDLTQEVLSTALRQKPRFEGPQLRAWLRTVTRRSAGALRRKDKRRQLAEVEATLRGEDVESAREQLLLHRRLQSALDELSDGDRTVIVLRYLEELSMPALADRLGVPEPTARKRVSRGLAHLRERLDRDCGDRRAWAAPLALLAPDVEHVPPGIGLSATLISLVTMKKALAAVLVVVGLALVVQRVTSKRELASGSARAAVATPMLDSAQVARELTIANAANSAADIDERHEVPAQPELLAPEAPRLVVLDPDGNPAANAVAVWIDARGGLNELALDAESTALLPPDYQAQSFLAAAPGFAAASVQPDGDDPLPLVMQLQRTAVLRGRVLVGGNAPSEPITLTCNPSTLHLPTGVDCSHESRRRLQELGLQPAKAEATTDLAGEFQFAGRHPLEQGAVELPGSFRLVENWRDYRTRYPSPKEPLSIEATRHPCLFGRVAWSHTRQPATGLYAGVYSGTDGSAPTGFSGEVTQSGRFEVPILDGEGGALAGGLVKLHFIPQVGVPQHHHFEFDFATSNAPIDLGNLSIDPVLPSTLRIVDTHGDPIAGASAFLWAGTRGPAAEREQSRADGLVTIVAAPDHLIAIFCHDYACVQSPLNALPLGPDGVCQVELSHGAQLRISTPTIRRFPLRGKVGWIKVEYDSPGARPRERLLLPPGVLPGLRDGRSSYYAGNFRRNESQSARFSLSKKPLEIGGLELGRQILVSLHTGSGESVAKQRLTLPLEPGVVDVVLMPEESESYSLTITLPDLTASQREEISVTLSKNDKFSLRSFRVGKAWCFEPLSTGIYTLGIRGTGFMAHREDVQLASGHQEITVTLQPGREILVKLLRDSTRRVLPDSIHLETAGGWRSHSWETWDDLHNDIFLSTFAGIPFSSVPLEPVTVVATFGDEEVLVPVLASESSVVIEARE